MRSAGTAALLGLALVAGCGGGRSYRPEPGPYDRVPGDWEEDLWRARFAAAKGERRVAHDLLLPLAEKRPELLGVRAFLQEVQLALLEAGEDVGGLHVPDPSLARAWLADVYRQRADADPDAPGYVLAARLEADGDTAVTLLDAALESDPNCVWGHYARAWWMVRLRRFPEAREQVEQAFELDGGHMPTMRLHASMLASAGETRPATKCLILWLERGEADPLVDPVERAEAQVDLAALLVLDREPEDALALLGALDGGLLREPARAELVRAVALEDLGYHAEALSSARRAKQGDPDGLLPLVYQAMILQREGNITQERALWEALLVAARDRSEAEGGGEDADAGELDFPALLIQLHARARLERLDRERPTWRPAP